MSTLAPTMGTIGDTTESANVCVFAATSQAARSLAEGCDSANRIVLGAQAEAGCKALDSYLRHDWEYRLISSFEGAARSWHRQDGGEQLFTLDGIDLADAGRFSFLTRVVLEKGRTLAAVSDALEVHAPSEVYCDAPLAPYLSVLYDGPLRICVRASTANTVSSAKETCVPTLGWRACLRELLLGVGYKLVCAATLSRSLQWRSGVRLPNAAPMLVGSEHGLKNLEPFFAQRKRPVNVLRPVGQLRRNRGLANTTIDWHVTYLESLLSTRDALRIVLRSIRVAQWFRETWRNQGFRNLFQWNGHDCLSLFAPEFARFVLAHSIGAFRNHYIAKALMRHRPARVFFDNANAWEFSVMVEHLRRANVPTSGFVNGLVQDIIPFRCDVDTLLTSGEWDRHLLQPVMPNSAVVAYGNPSAQEACNKRGNLLLVSSSCRDHENRRAFARVVAEYIEHFVGEHDFGEIVLKLHPYEDTEAMRSYFTEFPRAYARIRITRQGLEQELSRARLAVCLLSTVIRDLAWSGTPFLLFNSVEWPQHTFYSEIPCALRFTSASELATKAVDLNALREESMRVRDCYFGDRVSEASSLLSLHLFGEGE